MIYKQQFIKLISLAGNHLQLHKKGKIFITFPPNYIYLCDRSTVFILYFDLIKNETVRLHLRILDEVYDLYFSLNKIRRDALSYLKCKYSLSAEWNDRN